MKSKSVYKSSEKQNSIVSPNSIVWVRERNHFTNRIGLIEESIYPTTFREYIDRSNYTIYGNPYVLYKVGLDEVDQRKAWKEQLLRIQILYRKTKPVIARVLRFIPDIVRLIFIATFK